VYICCEPHVQASGRCLYRELLYALMLLWPRVRLRLTLVLDLCSLFTAGLSTRWGHQYCYSIRHCLLDMDLTHDTVRSRSHFPNTLWRNAATKLCPHGQRLRSKDLNIYPGKRLGGSPCLQPRSLKGLQEDQFHTERLSCRCVDSNYDSVRKKCHKTSSALVPSLSYFPEPRALSISQCFSHVPGWLIGCKVWVWT
jgi:hypothetical protein